MWTVVKNALANGATFVLHALILFFLTPFIVNRLGNEAFGLWHVVVTLTGYLGLLDLGTRSAIPKFIAQYRAEGDLDGLNRFAGTMLTLSLGLGGIALLGAGFLACVPHWFVETSAALRPLLPLLILVVGVNITMTFAFITFQGVLMGYQRFELANLFGVAGLLLRTALTVGFLLNGYGVVALAIIVTGCSLATWLMNVYFAYRIEPGLLLRLMLDRAQIRHITDFSITSFIINIADMFIFYSATLVVGKMYGTAKVALFAIAQSLVVNLREAILTIVTVLVPAASDLEAKKETGKLQTLAVLSTKAVLLMVMPVGLGVFFAGHLFILLWMGPGYSVSGDILCILVASQMLALSQQGPELILYGVNRHRALAVLLSIVAVLAVGASIVVGKAYGVVGVAIGCAIPLALGQAIFVPVFVRRYLGLPIGEYVRRAIVPVLAPSLVFAATLWAFGTMHYPTGWGGFFFEIFAALAIYVPAIYFLGCTADERVRLRAFLKNPRGTEDSPAPVVDTG
jgi:O-antigen/teichoic acid export membrane protein